MGCLFGHILAGDVEFASKFQFMLQEMYLKHCLLTIFIQYLIY